MKDLDFARFSIIDEYTLEELKRRYHTSVPRERIELVQRMYQTGIIPPYELARLAVDDQHVEVRQWMARHARHLDYREPQESGYRYPERNLIKRVQQDTDSFVRACLYENPDIFARSDEAAWHEMFACASHLERLAMVRNPNLQSAHRLLEAIFDPDDDSYGLSLEQREQLVNALLISRQALSENHRKGASVFAQPWDARLFSRIWRLINKWPKDAKIKRNIYLYVGTTIKTKAGIYRQCRQAALRADILRNVDSDDSDTLELGMKDADDLCRYLAYCKAKNFNAARFEMVLNKDDIHALSGLAENPHLSLSQLEQVKDRLFTLGAHEEARWASETIEKIRKRRAPTDPEKLFGPEGMSTEFTAEKLSFIGQQLMRLQRELDYVQGILEEHRDKESI